MIAAPNMCWSARWAPARADRRRLAGDFGQLRFVDADTRIEEATGASGR